MERTKTVSKSRVALTWAMMVGVIVAVTAVVFFLRQPTTSPTDQEAGSVDRGILHLVVFLFLGLFVLAGSVTAYVIVVLTGCFTFNYQRPVWKSVKTKQYICNLFVMVGFAIAIGLLASAFFGPMLTGLGLPPAQANLLPLLVAIVAFQIVRLWVLVWAPVEKKIITKRLEAQGITLEHIKSATLVGLSNPDTPMRRQLSSIEEDMGALWVTPDRLAFRGDVEQFDLTREHISQIERRAMKRSNTMLAGIEHVILHVPMGDGSVRQIRLHTEGVWTMGQKRRAMDALAYTITNWHSGVLQAPA